MNKKTLKTGILLTILGEILYFIFTITEKNQVSNFGEFTAGLLLGISIGIHIVGIILLIWGIEKKEQ